MNYKYLGKYHYIYRLTFSSSGVANVEKFPIVYSNKRYVYIKQAGSYELIHLCLSSYYSYDRQINTEFNEKAIESIVKRASESFSHGYGSGTWWFLLDDNKELIEWARNVKLDYTETYISEEIKRLNEKLVRQETYIKATKQEISQYEKKLAYYRANKEINNAYI